MVAGAEVLPCVDAHYRVELVVLEREIVSVRINGMDRVRDPRVAKDRFAFATRNP